MATDRVLWYRTGDGHPIHPAPDDDGDVVGTVDGVFSDGGVVDSVGFVVVVFVGSSSRGGFGGGGSGGGGNRGIDERQRLPSL